MKTLKVGDKQVPFDDSESVTGLADIFTEDRLIDGIIYLGFGALLTQTGSDETLVKGLAHLRMSPAMAERTIQVLQKLVQVSKTPIPPSAPRSTAN